MIDSRKILASILAVVGVVVLVIGCYQVRSGRKHARQSFFTTQMNPSADFQNKGIPTGQLTAIDQPQISDAQRERESLSKVITMMREFIVTGANSSMMYSQLKESGQNPDISAMSNPDTGSLITITTREPLFGTRYFRSVFESNGRNELMDFITFEFRPGERALEEAEETVRAIFNVGEPRSREGDVVVYNIDDSYEIMINRIVEDHLLGEPTRRRYTREDLGVIEVTVQLRQTEHEE